VVINSLPKKIQHHFDHRMALGIACLLVLGLGVRTVFRAQDWSSPHQLYYNDLTSSPDDYVAYTYVAIDLSTQQKLTDSNVYAKRAISIFPHGQAYNVLATNDVKLGNFELALQEYLAGLKARNTNQTKQALTDGAARLMIWYGPPQANEEFITNALKEFPQDPNLWLDLAVVTYKKGNPSLAKEAISQAYSLSQQPFIAQTYAAIMAGQPLNIDSPASNGG
jgi:tetratricopeptide (TPR) repeat protein